MNCPSQIPSCFAFVVCCDPGAACSAASAPCVLKPFSKSHPSFPVLSPDLSLWHLDPGERLNAACLGLPWRPGLRRRRTFNKFRRRGPALDPGPLLTFRKLCRLLSPCVVPGPIVRFRSCCPSLSACLVPGPLVRFRRRVRGLSAYLVSGLVVRFRRRTSGLSACLVPGPVVKSKRWRPGVSACSKHKKTQLFEHKDSTTETTKTHN